MRKAIAVAALITLLLFLAFPFYYSWLHRKDEPFSHLKDYRTGKERLMDTGGRNPCISKAPLSGSDTCVDGKVQKGESK